MDFSFLTNDSGIADSQTVEEVHHDNHNQEDESWKKIY